jgi:hypothetical protein
VQVAHIEPTLKPPGTKRLKPKCDQLLSTFAFNFNLRRYTLVDRGDHACEIVLLVFALKLQHPEAGPSN